MNLSIIAISSILLVKNAVKWDCSIHHTNYHLFLGIFENEISCCNLIGWFLNAVLLLKNHWIISNQTLPHIKKGTWEKTTTFSIFKRRTFHRCPETPHRYFLDRTKLAPGVRSGIQKQMYNADGRERCSDIEEKSPNGWKKLVTEGEKMQKRRAMKSLGCGKSRIERMDWLPKWPKLVDQTAKHRTLRLLLTRVINTSMYVVNLICYCHCWENMLLILNIFHRNIQPTHFLISYAYHFIVFCIVVE